MKKLRYSSFFRTAFEAKKYVSLKVPLILFSFLFATVYLANGYIAQMSSASTLSPESASWGVGDNAYGELGNWSTQSQSSPVQTYQSAQHTFSKIVGGYAFSLGLTAAGNVYAWGNNYSGQVGSGLSGQGNYAEQPYQVSGISHVINIAAGGGRTSGFAMALESNGTVWMWGDNSQGELGNGTADSNPHETPSEVLAPQGQSGYLSNIIAIAASNPANNFDNFAIAVRSDGTVWVWGYGQRGELGNGTAGSAGLSEYPVEVSNLSNIKKVAVGLNDVFALDSSGNVWDWGENSINQLDQTSNLSCNSTFYYGANNYGTYCLGTATEVSGLSNITYLNAGDMYGSYTNRDFTQSVFVQSGGAVYTMSGLMSSPIVQVSGVSNIVDAQFGYNQNIVTLSSSGAVALTPVNNTGYWTDSVGTTATLSGISKVNNIGTGYSHLMMLSSQ